MPADTVRALGLVPFELTMCAKRLRVVCAAPVPRAAMRALTKLTGWTPSRTWSTTRCGRRRSTRIARRRGHADTTSRR